MGRGGLLNQILNLIIRESINSMGKPTKSRPNSTASFKSNAERPHQSKGPVFKTSLQVPNLTYQLAARGLHAYPVVGESFYAKNFETLYKRFNGQAEVHTLAYLAHMPKNPVDQNAVAVVIDNLIVGHIPRHTASHFARFLSGRVGSCGARIYFNTAVGNHSVELDCDFPPRRKGDQPINEIPLLGADKSPDFSMGQITSRGSRLDWLLNKTNIVRVTAEAPYFGIAEIREGFGDPPSVMDAATNIDIGFPYETISYDFNIFARSWGGSARVRYKIELQKNGKPKVWLDASALPKFRRSKY